MRLITYNVNGIRAALGKGFMEWLKIVNPDILCLQEIKVQSSEFPHYLFEQLGYKSYIFPAEKKGYSGTAILTKLNSVNIIRGMGVDEYDKEGRVMLAQFENIFVINVYFPSGSSGPHRQESKFRFLNVFLPYAIQKSTELKNLIICGDFNICHKPIDIHDPIANKNSSGFLPEERAWMDNFFSSGYTDVFRAFSPDLPHQYTWWSYRAQARRKNKGWRIDYITCTDRIISSFLRCNILTEAYHSDHCPVLAELKSK